MAEKTLLDDILIAAPCSISWQDMAGDERKRFCNACQKNVYNISEMTRKEADQFLAENGTTQCLRFYRRADGTIIMNNCPVGLRKLKQKCQSGLRFVAGLVTLLIGAAPAAKADGTERPSFPTAGIPAMTSASQPARSSQGLIMSTGSQAPISHISTAGVSVFGPIIKNHTAVGYIEAKGKPVIVKTMINQMITDAMLQPYIPPPGFDQGFDGQSIDPFATNNGLGAGQPGSNLVKLRANYDVVLSAKDATPMHADMTALQLWQKARLFEDEGKTLLSLTHLKDALKACSEQVDADPVFKRFLESEIERMGNKVKDDGVSDLTNRPDGR